MLLAAVLVTADQLFSQESTSGTRIGLGTAESDILMSVLASPSAEPRGTQDLVHDYEEGMQFVTQQFSARVTEIAAAVKLGELSSEQAEEMHRRAVSVSANAV